MPHQSSAKGKGKAKAGPPSTFDMVDLTVDKPSNDDQLPSPPSDEQASSWRSTCSTGAGPSSTFFSTQGTKRNAQTLITSFFPNKKSRIQIVLPPPTPEEKKAVKAAEKAARDEARRIEKEMKEMQRAEEIAAKAEAKKIEREIRGTKKAEEDAAKAQAKTIEKEQKEAKKAEEQAARAERVATQQLKRKEREAERARKAVIKQRKDDWKEWVQRNQKPEATFKMKENQHVYLNIRECRERFGIQRQEVNCLEHCDVENPINPVEYAPMKIYKQEEVEMLAWRKEAIINGIAQNDEDALIREGRQLFNDRTTLKI